MIAVTETTRAYAEGNQLAWKESGVTEGKRWNTANDELVCPICGPLHNQIVKLDASFDSPGGEIDVPPAHPRCRCWITPITGNFNEDRQGIGIGEQLLPGGFSPADEIALIESAGFDLFASIRPPSGRAPRGQGSEYTARRRIVSRLNTQMRYRDQLQAQIDSYRGQANRRREITRITSRLEELNRGIDSALMIANEPGADWGFKVELIDDIINYVAKLTER